MRSRYGTCSSCGARVVWMRTAAGKGMPVEPETVPPGETTFDAKAGHVSHFAMCSNRDQHRRREEAPASTPPQAQQLALLPDLPAAAPEADEFGDLEAPTTAVDQGRWPFMDEARIAEFKRTLQVFRIEPGVFRAIREAQGITAPVETWSEREYFEAVALAIRTAMLRDAAAKGGVEEWQRARAQTGLEYEHEEFRRLIAGRKEAA